MKNRIYTTAGGMTGYKQIEIANNVRMDIAKANAICKGYAFLANYFASTGISPKNSPWEIAEGDVVLASYRNTEDMQEMSNLVTTARRKQLDQAIASLN
jgi:hypothetical protein